MNERVGIESGLYLENVLTLECTTVRKFGLNKSGYLISIAKDQYFYWTDLKKTDKSPHTLHSILHTLHTLHVDLVTFSHVECKLATRTRKPCRQSSRHIFDMLFFCGGLNLYSSQPLPHLLISPFQSIPPFPLLYPLFKNLHLAPLSTPTFKK